jgi:hypothetical protein
MESRRRKALPTKPPGYYASGGKKPPSKTPKPPTRWQPGNVGATGRGVPKGGWPAMVPSTSRGPIDLKTPPLGTYAEYVKHQKSQSKAARAARLLKGVAKGVSKVAGRARGRSLIGMAMQGMEKDTAAFRKALAKKPKPAVRQVGKSPMRGGPNRPPAKSSPHLRGGPNKPPTTGKSPMRGGPHGAPKKRK